MNLQVEKRGPYYTGVLPRNSTIYRLCEPSQVTTIFEAIGMPRLWIRHTNIARLGPRQ